MDAQIDRPRVEYPRTCKKCNKVYRSRRSYSAHKFVCQGSKIRCNTCHHIYSGPSTFISHKKNCQKMPKESHNQCPEPGCTYHAYHKTSVINHVVGMHLNSSKTYQLEFSNFNEFDAWKEEESIIHSTSFCKVSVDWNEIQYYVCSYYRNGEIGQHSHANCLSRIYVCISGEGLVVKYFSEHNHDQNLSDTEHSLNASKSTMQHFDGMKISPEYVKFYESNSIWEIHLKTNTDKSYTIEKVAEFCPLPDHCFFKCEVTCIELCQHLYNCSCDDKSGLCKHIHYIHKVHEELKKILLEGNFNNVENFNSPESPKKQNCKPGLTIDNLNNPENLNTLTHVEKHNYKSSLPEDNLNSIENINPSILLKKQNLKPTLSDDDDIENLNAPMSSTNQISNRYAKMRTEGRLLLREVFRIYQKVPSAMLDLINSMIENLLTVCQYSCKGDTFQTTPVKEVELTSNEKIPNQNINHVIGRNVNDKQQDEITFVKMPKQKYISPTGKHVNHKQQVETTFNGKTPKPTSAKSNRAIEKNVNKKQQIETTSSQKSSAPKGKNANRHLSSRDAQKYLESNSFIYEIVDEDLGLNSETDTNLLTKKLKLDSDNLTRNLLIVGKSDEEITAPLLTINGFSVSLIEIKSLDLDLPENDVNYLKTVDSKFTKGHLYDSVVDAYVSSITNHSKQFSYINAKIAKQLANAEFTENSKENILVSCVLKNHWILIKMNKPLREICIFDPLNESPVTDRLKTVTDYCSGLMGSKKWNIKIQVGHKLKDDSSSFGVYICYYASKLVGIEVSDQEFDHIHFRKHIFQSLMAVVGK